MSYIINSQGKAFNYLDPAQSFAAIVIEDIAESLAKEARFAGKTPGEFYSVAQHSVYVSACVPRAFAMEGLLHDAAEAYCKDLPKPLKALLPDYQVVEKRVDLVIRQRFGLPVQLSAEVKEVDSRLLVTERRDLLPFRVVKEYVAFPDVAAYTSKIVPWGWREALHRFLTRYYELSSE